VIEGRKIEGREIVREVVTDLAGGVLNQGLREIVERGAPRCCIRRFGIT
jgi:hypothetical protein